MDETLGKMMRNTFAVRPYTDSLINLLRLCRFDIILWSLGTDEYVQRIVNGHLPIIKRYAKKIFGRKECARAKQKYGYDKASDHIRVMYDREDLYLVAIDDKVSENMDTGYDLRINVLPYNRPNVKDKVLLDVIDKLVSALVKFKEERSLLLPPVYSDLAEPLDEIYSDDDETFVEHSWIC